MFADRIFLGKVGVAKFILDHGPGYPLGRAAGPAASRAGEDEPDEKVNEIGNQKIEN
jgi:hypothetical protein